MSINWRQYIHSDPNVSTGEQIVKGTQLSVEFLLELLAKGWSVEKILKNYPDLTRNGLMAVLAFAAELTKDKGDDDAAGAAGKISPRVPPHLGAKAKRTH